jgi:hypothetical protein
VVTKVAKEEAPELEDMQCKDKYCVWSGFVTEDANSSDLEDWMHITDRQEVPIFFTEVRFMNASILNLVYSIALPTTLKIRTKSCQQLIPSEIFS